MGIPRNLISAIAGQPEWLPSFTIRCEDAHSDSYGTVRISSYHSTSGNYKFYKIGIKRRGEARSVVPVNNLQEFFDPDAGPNAVITHRIYYVNVTLADKTLLYNLVQDYSPGRGGLHLDFSSLGESGKHCRITGNLADLLYSKNEYGERVFSGADLKDAFSETRVSNEAETGFVQFDGAWLPDLMLPSGACYKMFGSDANSGSVWLHTTDANLSAGCFDWMFASSAIQKVTVAFTDWQGGSFTRNWFLECENHSSSCIFRCPEALPEIRGDSYIPEGWSIERY